MKDNFFLFLILGLGISIILQAFLITELHDYMKKIEKHCIKKHIH